MRRGPIGPLISLLAIIATAILGGNLFLAVDARGRVLDDWNDTPIANAQIRYGTRMVLSEADGTFVFSGLPRTALVNIRAVTYASTDVPAGDVGDVRMRPATLNLQVNDSATGLGVKNPEVRKDSEVLGTGTENGDMAIAHPGKDVNFTVCATKYATKEVHTTLTHLTVQLDPSPAGACTTPTPPPSPSPSASPSGSPAPSLTPSPSGSP